MQRGECPRLKKKTQACAAMAVYDGEDVTMNIGVNKGLWRCEPRRDKSHVTCWYHQQFKDLLWMCGLQSGVLTAPLHGSRQLPEEEEGKQETVILKKKRHFLHSVLLWRNVALFVC